MEPTFVFWKALGIFKQGGMAEAIREVEGIHRRQDVQYAATVALIHFHKACKIPDHVMCCNSRKRSQLWRIYFLRPKL